MTVLAGRILTPAGWVDGELEFGERVVGVRSGQVPADAPYVVPGFIDVHVHGGGGHDTMDGPEGVLGLAAFHVRHGTTALLATTITNPWERVLAALAGVREAMGAARGERARVLGAHLEGPFISPRRLGAQPPNAVDPAPELVRQALESGVVKVATVAPEVPQALEAIAALSAAGVRVSLGHTVAIAEQALAAINAGARGGTHLFNAMSPYEGRSPGVVGALLASRDTFAELILDGHHVHFTSFRAAHAAKGGRLLLVTDCMRAGGLPDGESELGGARVVLSGGTVRLADGTLAGSVLTLDVAVRNAVVAGLALEDALRAASTVPADYLGLSDRGRLQGGAWADVLLLDRDLRVREVYVEGQRAA